MTLTSRLIEYLSSRPGIYSSGQKLADGLGVTRAAVWKAVESLRADGYGIDSVRAKGYMLKESPDRLGELEIASGLGTKFVGRNMQTFDETGSTNREAMRLASEGAPDGTVVVAEAQTEGRGRLGRIWISPPRANIYASVILRPDFPPTSAPLITLAASVALARAVASHCEVEARIKWPNDVLIGGRKLAGILTEMSSEPDRIRHVVVGFGVNVNSEVDDFPADVRVTATSVRSVTGKDASRAGLLKKILEELERSYLMLTAGERDAVLDEWRGLSDTLGRRVRVVMHGSDITGRVVDIDSSGALIVEQDDGISVTVTSGDVVHLR
jgi:BirA family biotin operon repressor/biotin-[acetyl-CoA-carboxylase] ligase